MHYGGPVPATTRTFDFLTPHAILDAVESAYGLRLDGTLSAYHSYVNRVFSVTAEEGPAYVAKFYRPGRWTEDAILDEHQFVEECAAAELPVAVPLPDADGVTLQSVELEAGDAREEFFFALYERKGGLAFDAERDEDWQRLGGLVGRMHAVAVRSSAPHRLECLPGSSTAMFLDELAQAGVVHPKCEGEFFSVAREALAAIAPLFEGVPLQRIHGDCHRGNILDRPGEGLLLIDFDDMMSGPAVQDLWLLLPDRASASRRELALITEGYEEFRPLAAGGHQADRAAAADAHAVLPGVVRAPAGGQALPRVEPRAGGRRHSGSVRSRTCATSGRRSRRRDEPPAGPGTDRRAAASACYFFTCASRSETFCLGRGRRKPQKERFSTIGAGAAACATLDTGAGFGAARLDCFRAACFGAAVFLVAVFFAAGFFAAGLPFGRAAFFFADLGTEEALIASTSFPLKYLRLPSFVPSFLFAACRRTVATDSFVAFATCSTVNFILISPG